MFNWIKRHRMSGAAPGEGPLPPQLAQQVQALRKILESLDIEFKPVPGASEQEISAVEAKVGIRLDPELRALYRFSNGSNDETWFAVYSDEVTPCAFVPLQEALEVWGWFEPYDEAVYQERKDKNPERDSRIQPFLVHRGWFPIAQFNGFSTTVYFDTAPAGQGAYGQIIVYQHDPDAMYYVAPSFLEFLTLSNKLIAENLDDIFPEE